jgi:hypothetical protein
MVDQYSETLPPRVMDLLKMFLAVSSRGEQAVLVLETRHKTLTTKFKSVEKVTGSQPTLLHHHLRREGTPQPGQGGPNSGWMSLTGRRSWRRKHRLKISRMTRM